jgi:defect-in-organelle-trafficking protein DotB
MSDFTGSRRRLRLNMTATKSIRSNQNASLVLRPLMDTPPLPSELGLPQELLDKCYPRDGAVYVIGPTGSGKTATFGSLIRHAAATGCAWSGHLATYESPPEFDLQGLTSKHLLITQVAIGINSPWGLLTFADGARNAMRRHPCAVLIGEVRDYETVTATVELALTGHPVLATTHASSPAVAFQRLVTRYPYEQQRAGLYDLIMTTQLIVAQLLIPSTDGKRVAIREWIAFDDELRLKLLALESPGAVVGAIKALTISSGNSFRSAAHALLAENRISEQVARQFF